MTQANSMFSNGSGESLTFAKFNSKLGAFVVKDKEGKKTQFSQIRDVVITKLGLRDGEYEGQPYTELVMRLKNANGSSQVSFNIATSACAKMVSILNAADLSKPLGFSGQLLAKGTSFKGSGGEAVVLENDLVSISIYQNGFLKPSAEVPKVVMVKVGNKEVADTSARDAFTEAQIALLESKMTAPVDQAVPADSDTASNTGFDSADDEIPF